jgi:hypothetical protein
MWGKDCFLDLLLVAFLLRIARLFGKLKKILVFLKASGYYSDLLQALGWTIAL